MRWPFWIVALLSCATHCIVCNAIVQAPDIMTDGLTAQLVWESYPSWFLQYTTGDELERIWKRVPGSLGADTASVAMGEDQYFFRLVEGSPFQEATLPIAGGTIDLGDGVSITVPEYAWYSAEMGSVDLDVRIRLLEAFEADPIIEKGGLIDKSFLGGVEIELVGDHSLTWYAPVVIKFPTLQPIGNSTVPVGSTISLEHGIYNFGPTDIAYDFDTESVEMHISELLPTASGNDYREHQDSMVYAVLGANLATGEEKLSQLSMDINPTTSGTERDTLPPYHPCRKSCLASSRFRYNFNRPSTKSISHCGRKS